MGNNKISVIIPYYDCQEYVFETIDSVLNQDYPYVELIVINDGSPCDLNDALEKDSKCRGYTYKYKKNGGVSSALNLGVKISSGSYISWVACDDVMLPHRLKKQIKVLNQMGVDGCATYVERIDKDGKFLNQKNPKKKGMVDFDYFYTTDFYFPAPSVLCKKEALITINGFDEQLIIEDWDLWLNLTSHGYKLYLHDEVCTQYRIHNSMSSNLVKMFSGICDVTLKYKSHSRFIGFKIITHHFIKNSIKSILKLCFCDVVLLTKTYFVSIYSMAIK
ncbi:glycosyltransferase [Psychromonas sp. SA13A]|uniref:glycosyltransferase family 2 protein n=1 Tax=Psychromonas sp. SA13A TaxID=2686346 RepID=UPI001407B627|nr:glycosyltransferase [Psychromonas sp. SA13A]